MNVDSSSCIHPSAVISPGASIGPGCIIGPYAVIGPDVSLGPDVEVKSHAVIDGWTTIGANTTIHSFASIGSAPQNIRYEGERTRVVIGERNQIFQYTTISIGTESGGGVTEIGNDCMLMVGAHVAHDCKIGNHVVMVNHSAAAGHCTIGDRAMIGAHAGVHQNCRVGEGAMIGALSAVVRDVIPYGLVYDDRTSLRGLNIVGLRRRGIKSAEIRKLQSAFDAIFRKSRSIRESAEEYRECSDTNDLIADMVEFILVGGARNLCTLDPVTDLDQ